MSRAVVILNSSADRARAVDLISRAPAGTRVDVKLSKRTLPQNDLIHALCTDIARQLTWHGQRWTMEDWKKNLVGCFKSDLRTMPRADGFGVIPVGGTSDLTKEEAGDFIEFVYAFAAREGITLNDGREAA